jgi:hypothetical protein
MHKAKLGVFLLLVALAAGNAEAQKVTSDYDPAGDFDSYHTFMWIQSSSDDNHGELQRVISAQLTAKDWTQVSAGADVGVAVNVASKKVRTADAFYRSLQGWNWRRWDERDTSSTDVDFYSPGTMLVDMFDAKSHKLIWRGIAIGAFSAKGGGDHADKDLKRMFKDFPPKWIPRR